MKINEIILHFEMEIVITFMSQLLLIWQRSKISFYAFISLVFLCLLAYNGATIFFINIPFPAKIPLPEQLVEPRAVVHTLPSTKFPSTAQLSAKNVTLLPKNQNLVVLTNRTTSYSLNRKKKIYKNVIKILHSSEAVNKQFGVRVMKFFKSNSSDSSCKFRFFMTWISSVESFGERELMSVERLFKTHPYSCLIIVSDSLDSQSGFQILRPFSDKGFKITAISPDFNYLLKNTAAEAWYNQLKRGHVNPGEISLGQNLSNLLRIGLLYRFGGIYLDTDIIILKSFGVLKNAIGAQANDPATGNWSRLNNAVMIFNKGHPLLHEFLQEFALTFDGNRWGHNGPYLVSRVVARISERPRFNLTVLPPMAFYPVTWNRIGSLFEGPKSLSHSKWILGKLRQIRSHSFAVHLWNKQSTHFKVENGSIIQHITFSSSFIRNSLSKP
ncbi:hypothetical protein OROMI_000599 [Orobanche minor]